MSRGLCDREHAAQNKPWRTRNVVYTFASYFLEKKQYFLKTKKSISKIHIKILQVTERNICFVINNVTSWTTESIEVIHNYKLQHIPTNYFPITFFGRTEVSKPCLGATREEFQCLLHQPLRLAGTQSWVVGGERRNWSAGCCYWWKLVF